MLKNSSQFAKFKSFALKPLSILCFFSVLAAAWISWNWQIYGSLHHLLPRDNAHDHFPLFLYISKTLHSMTTFPTWIFTRQGGLWVEPLTNNFHLLLPHRLVGYFLAALTPIHPVILYKMCFLVLGHAVFFCGIYFCAKEFFKSKSLAVITVLMGLLSSIYVGTFHQEHALSTVFYFPFIWLCLMRLHVQPRLLIVAATLLGITLNNHYPQLVIGYAIVLLLSLGFDFERSAVVFKNLFKQYNSPQGKFICVASLLCFFVGASPLFYSYFSFENKLISPFRRQGETISAGTYEDYLKIHTKSTSLAPENLKIYGGFDFHERTEMSDFDDFVFYLTPAVPLMLALLLFLPIPWKIFHLSVLVCLAFCSVGVYGPAPRILWWVLPGIKLFRQWYHFLPILNLHLLFLVGLTLREFVKLDVSGSRALQLRLAGAIGLLVLSALFGFISPLYGIIGAAIILLKFLPKNNELLSRRMIFCSLVLWIGVTGILWSVESAKKYQAGMIPTQERMLTEKWKEVLDWQPVESLGRTLVRFMVAPKDTKPDMIQYMTEKSFFYWLMKNNELEKAEPKDIILQPIASGINIGSVKVPENATALILLQLNDGRWKVTNSGNPPTPAIKGPLNTILFPTYGRTLSYTLARELSAWYVLVWIMWFPLAFSLWFLRRDIHLPFFSLR